MSANWVDAAALGFRFFLAFVFLATAIPKLINRRAFRQALTNYELLPTSATTAVAVALPILELVCAIALFIGLAVLIAGVLAAALLVAFSAAVSINLIRGRRINCGCSGSLAPREISWSLVLRNLGLASSAAFAAAINPNALSVGIVTAGHSVPSNDALAMMYAAGALVLTRLLLSAWQGIAGAIPERAK